MHQYKTLAQIILFFSIFNLVFTAPVVRETYDAHDDVAVPVVVRNVVAMSKERRQPNEPTPSQPSPPPPDGSTPSLDEPTPLHESPSPPAGPAALAVSSPPGGMASLPVIPASDQPVPAHSPSTSQHFTAITHDMLAPERLSPAAEMKRFQTLAKVVAIGGTIIIITGGLLWQARHSLRRRTIGPDSDWYVFNPSHLSCRRLNVLNHDNLADEISLSSTAKGSRHPCLDN
jgi:hypothetical protein